MTFPILLPVPGTHFLKTWFLVSPNIPVPLLYIWCNTPKYFMLTEKITNIKVFYLLKCVLVLLVLLFPACIVVTCKILSQTYKLSHLADLCMYDILAKYTYINIYIDSGHFGSLIMVVKRVVVNWGNNRSSSVVVSRYS